MNKMFWLSLLGLQALLFTFEANAKAPRISVSNTQSVHQNEIVVDARDPLNDPNKMIYMKYHYFGASTPDASEGENIETWRWKHTYMKRLYSYNETTNTRAMVLENEPYILLIDLVSGRGMRLQNKSKVPKVNTLVYILPEQYHLPIEIGNEVYYFEKNNARQIAYTPNTGFVLNTYQLDTSDYVITLYTHKNTNYPARVVFNAKSKDNAIGDFGIEYDEYRDDLKPDVNVFNINAYANEEKVLGYSKSKK